MQPLMVIVNYMGVIMNHMIAIIWANLVDNAALLYIIIITDNDAQRTLDIFLDYASLREDNADKGTT